MTPPSPAHDYGEDAAIEQPAIQLFASMGWETVNLYNEWASGKSTEGRQSEREIVLEARLRSGITRLNPGLPPSAIDQVVEEVTLDRSRMIPVNANRELWQLTDLSVDCTVLVDRPFLAELVAWDAEL